MHSHCHRVDTDRLSLALTNNESLRESVCFASWFKCAVASEDLRTLNLTLCFLDAKPPTFRLRVHDLFIRRLLALCTAPSHIFTFDFVRRLLSEQRVWNSPMNAMMLRASMISAYGRCGDADSARLELDVQRNPSADALIVGAMLSVYVDADRSADALELFEGGKYAIDDCCHALALKVVLRNRDLTDSVVECERCAKVISARKRAFSEFERRAQRPRTDSAMV